MIRSWCLLLPFFCDKQPFQKGHLCTVSLLGTLWNKSFNSEKIQPILIPSKIIPVGLVDLNSKINFAICHWSWEIGCIWHFLRKFGDITLDCPNYPENSIFVRSLPFRKFSNVVRIYLLHQISKPGPIQTLNFGYSGFFGYFRIYPTPYSF